MQKAVKRAARKGTGIIISGAYIGTDIEDSIYPIQLDSAFRAEAAGFARDVLGYRFVTNQASRTGRISPVRNGLVEGHEALEFATEANPHIYCVESPDGIAPADANGAVIYRYTDSMIPAGVAHQGNGYRCVSYGFPIETLTGEDAVNRLISTTLEYLKK